MKPMTYEGIAEHFIYKMSGMSADEQKDWLSYQLASMMENVKLNPNGRMSPNMALLERCREACMRVSHDANEAAKAKDATDYVAGYQDACVDVDEEIREMMKDQRSET